MKRTSLDVGSMEIQSSNLTLGEEGISSQKIEVPSIADLTPKGIELEAFMNEEVEVYLPAVKGEPITIPVTITVNGVRQHIFRGVNQKIKRKYLEALARSVTTDYTQDEAKMFESGALPDATTAQTYNFAVRRDTPEGIAWLQELQSQPA